MIRDYTDRDRDGVLSLIQTIDNEYEVGDIDDIRTNATKFLVYNQNGIQGFAYSTILENDVGKKEAQISLYVEPGSRGRGLGASLYKEMESHLLELQPDYLSSYMRVDVKDFGRFAEKMGFEKWWGSPVLIYNGDGFPPSDLEFHKYEDKYFQQYVQLNQECYYPITKSNDLEPYIATEEMIETYKLNNKDKVYLVLDGDQIIASVTIGDGTLDNLLVSPEYQGKGYGRKAFQFGVNKVVKQGYNEIQICYMENNKKAEKLYLSLGFEPHQNTHVYRKFIKA